MVTISYEEITDNVSVSSISPQSQFYDHETDFCRVYTEKALQNVQKLLLRGGVSYFIKQEGSPFLVRMLHGEKAFCRCMVRVHEAEIDRAVELCDGLDDVEFVCTLPEKDYCARDVKAAEKAQRTRKTREEAHKKRTVETSSIQDTDDEEEQSIQIGDIGEISFG